MPITFSKKTIIFVFIYFICPFSFPDPVFDINDRYLLQDAQVQHEYYFLWHGPGSYVASYIYPRSYQAAEQFQKLLEAKVLVKSYEAVEQSQLARSNTSKETDEFKEKSQQAGIPGYTEDIVFFSVFKTLPILTFEELDILLAAFTSPIYKSSPDAKTLIYLYNSIVYGSRVHATMVTNIDLNMESSVFALWVNFCHYYMLGSKPEMQRFLASTYANGGFLSLYNPPHSHFLAALFSFNNEHYLTDIVNEFGYVFLNALSCNYNRKELRNTALFLEACKVNLYYDGASMEGLDGDKDYFLRSATPGQSEVHLIPVEGYTKDLDTPGISPEERSYKSLHNIMSRVVDDKQEGVLFFVLYRGDEKYQFFTVGFTKGICLYPMLIPILPRHRFSVSLFLYGV